MKVALLFVSSVGVASRRLLASERLVWCAADTVRASAFAGVPLDCLCAVSAAVSGCRRHFKGVEGGSNIDDSQACRPRGQVLDKTCRFRFSSIYIYHLTTNKLQNTSFATSFKPARY